MGSTFFFMADLGSFQFSIPANYFLFKTISLVDKIPSYLFVIILTFLFNLLGEDNING